MGGIQVLRVLLALRVYLPPLLLSIVWLGDLERRVTLCHRWTR